jgi:hypothetical protein
LAESGMDGKSKIGEDLLKVLKFPLFLRRFININRNKALQRKEMEIATF